MHGTVLSEESRMCDSGCCQGLLVLGGAKWQCVLRRALQGSPTFSGMYGKQSNGVSEADVAWISPVCFKGCVCVREGASA